ncbi:DivIVA domain-containing protein [Gordonia polyisoprenivorans]|uniref:DivIVA domain-containing protein n=1 Tax=Gordonia polyisoprenivorans TaxID=84595 RepID=UPI001AD77E46|nr:DivIVA domain-containing protein [Gordonia polyisoprenivorans]QTI67848.1 DivIVA domain-containing protein [Gordonia polyisoprenivorans]
MQTLLLYLLIMAVVVAVVFAVVWFVFGRGEDLPPVDATSTLTRLPRNGINGYDVRTLRFALTVRGYKQSEVDWALARLADEIDDLRALIQQLQDRDAASVHPVAAGIGRHEAGTVAEGVDGPQASAVESHATGAGDHHPDGAGEASVDPAAGAVTESRD